MTETFLIKKIAFQSNETCLTVYLLEMKMSLWIFEIITDYFVSFSPLFIDHNQEWASIDGLGVN